jgi:hypothetical protein
MDRMRKKSLIISMIVVMAAGATVVLLWTKPWTAFIDATVDEVAVSESTQPANSGDEDSESVAAVPVVIATGSFMSQDHQTSGQVEVVELTDGSRVLTLVDLQTDNGPDVHVYFGTNPANITDGLHSDLGLMKGNIGTQNYELPAELNPSDYSIISLWCNDFASPFGFATLQFNA